MIEQGDVAPDFTLSDQDGNEVSLSKLRGKAVVLYYERTTFVIDPDGTVAEVLRKVKPAEHDDLVLAALGES